MPKLDPPKLSPRGRKVKILATVGPASREPEMLRRLFRAGVDAFRVNMSHGDHATHAETIKAIRALESEFDRPIAILADLQGPKLRVGTFKDGKAVIRHSGHFTLDRKDEPGDETRVCLPHPELFGLLEKGQRLLINDGKIRLRVIRADENEILCSAEVGGVISDRKGVNVPDAEIPIPALTDKDRKDLAFACKHGADWIALSFVQRPEDVAEARKLMTATDGTSPALCAKIEKPSAVRRLEEIVELSDGIMVARGDLGVELDPEDVPPLQKRIVEITRQAGKPVIVATQMLESMIESPAPTRAEVSDVANAVYDGADAVMLSAETAAGGFAVESVAMMDRIITTVEGDSQYRAHQSAAHFEPEATTSDAITLAARQVVETIGAACIVTYTTSGSTTLRAARERPSVPILCITSSERSARRLAMVWGVHAVHITEEARFSAVVNRALEIAAGAGFAAPGDKVVITAGVPMGTPGSTNVLRVERIPGTP